MFTRFLIGSTLVGLTIAIHALGTTRWMHFLISRYAGRDGNWSRPRVLGVLISTGVVLLLLHVAEVMLWAVTYLALPGTPELSTLEQATYFSLITFTTVGYGDITLGPRWQLLSGLEGMNGVLLFGWSTAFLYSVVQRSWRVVAHRTGKAGTSGDHRPEDHDAG